MKKILFVAPNLKPGGAEKVLVKILNNIDKKNYDIKLILLKKTGNLINTLDSSVDVIDLDIEKSIFSMFKLYKVIKKEKPEVIFSIIGQINIILAFFKVFFFKDIFFIGRENAVYSEWLYKDITFTKRIMHVLYRVLLNKLDIVLAQSNFMKEQIIEFFNVPIEKINTFYNPIEISKINILKNKTINNKNWNRDKVNLIAIGRIEDVKNYKDMVDVVARLDEKFHLNIFGSGSKENELISYLQSKKLTDRVTLYGFVENPYKYIKSSFILLLTSKRESLPNVVLEASACGVYTIAYNMPGGISEIIMDKVNGELVGNGNIVEMSEKISKIYNNGYDKEKVKASSTKYNIKEYIENITNLLDSKV